MCLGGWESSDAVSLVGVLFSGVCRVSVVFFVLLFVGLSCCCFVFLVCVGFVVLCVCRCVRV